MTDDPTGSMIVHGLLLTRDLMFTSKVMGTAAALGLRIETVGAIDALQTRAVEVHPRVVFIDLGCTEFAPQAVMDRLRADPRPVVIAYGAHVDVERLEAAVAAGCDDAQPRSRFSATLADQLRQIFELD
ncbi:MAG: response regulator [Planctomycetes bacterium]|nr:response regulator [Planctomycetota bacterium]